MVQHGKGIIAMVSLCYCFKLKPPSTSGTNIRTTFYHHPSKLMLDFSICVAFFADLLCVAPTLTTVNFKSTYQLYHQCASNVHSISLWVCIKVHYNELHVNVP